MVVLVVVVDVSVDGCGSNGNDGDDREDDINQIYSLHYGLPFYYSRINTNVKINTYASFN